MVDFSGDNQLIGIQPCGVYHPDSKRRKRNSRCAQSRIPQNEFIEQWFTRGIYSLFPAGSTPDFIIDLDTVRSLNKRSHTF